MAATPLICALEENSHIIGMRGDRRKNDATQLNSLYINNCRPDNLLSFTVKPHDMNSLSAELWELTEQLFQRIDGSAQSWHSLPV